MFRCPIWEWTSFEGFDLTLICSASRYGMIVFGISDSDMSRCPIWNWASWKEFLTLKIDMFRYLIWKGRVCEAQSWHVPAPDLEWHLWKAWTYCGRVDMSRCVDVQWIFQCEIDSIARPQFVIRGSSVWYWERRMFTIPWCCMPMMFDPLQRSIQSLSYGCNLLSDFATMLLFWPYHVAGSGDLYSNYSPTKKHMQQTSPRSEKLYTIIKWICQATCSASESRLSERLMLSSSKMWGNI